MVESLPGRSAVYVCMMNIGDSVNMGQLIGPWEILVLVLKVQSLNICIKIQSTLCNIPLR